MASDRSLISGREARGMKTLPTKIEDGSLMVRFEFFRQLTPKKARIVLAYGPQGVGQDQKEIVLPSPSYSRPCLSLS